MLGQMAARNLQGKIAPEENAGNGAGLLGVEMEVAADARKGERDVGAVDEGDGVHDESDGDDAGPAGWGSHSGACGGREVWAGNGLGGGVHRLSLRRFAPSIKTESGWMVSR